MYVPPCFNNDVAMLDGFPQWLLFALAVVLPLVSLAAGGLSVYVNQNTSSNLLCGLVTFPVHVLAILGVFAVDFELIDRLGSPQGENGLGIVLQVIAFVCGVAMWAVGTFDLD